MASLNCISIVLVREKQPLGFYEKKGEVRKDLEGFASLILCSSIGSLLSREHKSNETLVGVKKLCHFLWNSYSMKIRKKIWSQKSAGTEKL